MKKYIDAVMWFFGMTKKSATKYCKESSAELLDEILKAFEDNAKKCFYDD